MLVKLLNYMININIFKKIIILIYLSAFFVLIFSFFINGKALHPDDWEYMAYARYFSKNYTLIIPNHEADKTGLSYINTIGNNVLIENKNYSVPGRFYGQSVVLGVLIKVFNSEYILKLINPIMAVLSIMFFYLIRKKIGLKKNILFALFFSISPFFLYVSCFLDGHLMAIFFMLLSIFLYLKNLYFLPGISIGMMVFIRPESIILIPAIILFLYIYKKNITVLSCILILIGICLPLFLMFFINTRLYGNLFTFGYYSNVSENINNPLNVAIDNIFGKFNFFISNLSSVATLLIFGSPLLLIMPFSSRNKYLLVFFVAIIFFLFTISKPFNGYGSEWELQTTISSPERYLSLFYTISLLVISLKKNRLNKILLIFLLIINVYIIFAQQVFPFTAIWSEKNIFAIKSSKLIDKNIKNRDFIITSNFIKWIDPFNKNYTDSNSIIMGNNNDLNTLKQNYDNVYLIPFGLDDWILFDKLSNNGLIPLNKIDSINILHYRGVWFGGFVNHIVSIYKI